LKGKRGRGTAQEDKPPILGMIQRNGLVIIEMLENVQVKSIQPIIRKNVKESSVVYTDEYNIYNWLSNFYEHKTVNHGQKEYARDEDGDGKCEVHVNTIEGFWSLLRPWLRPHHGISQEKLPYYLGFFEFLHNIRKRGQNLLLLIC
jgi:transposase-like protein